MPKKKLEYPDCPRMAKYAPLRELALAVAHNKIPLVCVVGPPGLGKSEVFEKALSKTGGLFLRPGQLSLLKIHVSVYEYKDRPICIDDHGLDKTKKQVLMGLSESREFKAMNYQTFSKILVEARVPNSYTTTGSVAILSNTWDDEDPLCQALASRAMMVRFDPDWCEVYKYVGSWFWDQDIFDYLHHRLEDLKQPDVRLLSRAWYIKHAGLKSNKWQDVIDAHVDDAAGLLVRQLIRDESFPTNTARQEAYCQQAKEAKLPADRATFYRKLKAIKSYMPKQKPARIILKHTEPPKKERPADSPVLPADNPVLPIDRAG